MYYVYQLNTASYVTDCTAFVDREKAIETAKWWQERTDQIHGQYHYRATHCKGLDPVTLAPIHEIIWDGRGGGF